jgi:hypothetical protein
MKTQGQREKENWIEDNRSHYFVIYVHEAHFFKFLILYISSTNDMTPVINLHYITFMLPAGQGMSKLVGWGNDKKSKYN